MLDRSGRADADPKCLFGGGRRGRFAGPQAAELDVPREPADEDLRSASLPVDFANTADAIQAFDFNPLIFFEACSLASGAFALRHGSTVSRLQPVAA